MLATKGGAKLTVREVNVAFSALCCKKADASRFGAGTTPLMITAYQFRG